MEFSEESYHQIEPKHDFDLDATEPEKIRPFKPKYHLTMGMISPTSLPYKRFPLAFLCLISVTAITNTTLSDLIAMDRTYKSRIALREQLIRDYDSDVIAATPIVEPAVREIYTWLTSVYLPRRFPTLYTITPTGLHNNVTDCTLPLFPSNTEEALRVIGRNVDNDFLFLLPIKPGNGEKEEDVGKYRLEGFVTCFPSGFNTRKKLGLKLGDIHTPVPSYAERLEKSMDRFFASLPVGRIVKRHNWTITTNRDLFCLAGNHEYSASPADVEKDQAAVEIDQTVLRCERQTLHRLPQTKALVFASKTYQYELQEIRDEGLGEDLAEAIEGLGNGNAPGMTVYKRQVVYGEKVCAFLRGESVR